MLRTTTDGTETVAGRTATIGETMVEDIGMMEGMATDIQEINPTAAVQVGATTGADAVIGVPGIVARRSLLVRSRILPSISAPHTPATVAGSRAGVMMEAVETVEGAGNSRQAQGRNLPKRRPAWRAWFRLPTTVTRNRNKPDRWCIPLFWYRRNVNRVVSARTWEKSPGRRSGGLLHVQRSQYMRIVPRRRPNSEANFDSRVKLLLHVQR